eukprot:TRINITY_DN15000_c0_g1_i2.p1 TRINITY_DN15000_c0_g1~~TRINITY_DN15000_c0_g1_i2.p1  ORF type:complete len:352 (+),score=60.07 TRINITY_DN15000_c0_g1_i2:159-1214(+)
MFYGPLKNSTTQLELDDPFIKYQAFYDLIQFIYTGATDFTGDNILYLVYLSRLYNLHVLEVECLQSVQHNINTENCLSLLESRSLFGNNEHILNTSLTILAKYAKIILARTTPDMMSLTTLLEVLRHPHLDCTETDIFRFVQKWIAWHGPGKEEREEILGLVRFPLMSVEELETLVKPTELVPLEVIEDALAHKKGKREGTSMRYQPRIALYSTVVHDSHFWKLHCLESLSCSKWTCKIEQLQLLSNFWGLVVGAIIEKKRVNTWVSKIGWGYVATTGEIRGVDENGVESSLVSAETFTVGDTISIVREDNNMLAFYKNDKLQGKTKISKDRICPAVSVACKTELTFQAVI